MTVEVSTTQYEFAHGRRPRGTGYWAFVANDETRFFNGTYSAARAEAVEWARSMNVGRVEVGS